LNKINNKNELCFYYLYFKGVVNIALNQSKAPILTFTMTLNIVSCELYCLTNKTNKKLTFGVYDLTNLITSNELVTSAVNCSGLLPFERYQISLDPKIVGCEFNKIDVITGMLKAFIAEIK
jgi:hypothetical protein